MHLVGSYYAKNIRLVFINFMLMVYSVTSSVLHSLQSKSHLRDACAGIVNVLRLLTYFGKRNTGVPFTASMNTAMLTRRKPTSTGTAVGTHIRFT